MSTAEQCKAILAIMTDWAVAEQGKAVICADLAHLYEVAAIVAESPRVLIICDGESPRGPFEISSVTGRVDRTFKVAVTRGKSMSDDRGQALTDTTGNALAFYDLVEQVRDKLRASVGLGDEQPVDYRGMTPFDQPGRLIDGKLLEFTIGTDLPVISNAPANPAPPIGT